MSKKILPAFLALAALLSAAPARASYARAGAPDAEEMTDEEAREARALAARFVERLRETDDFAPLVAEFFPADFDEQLKRVLLAAPKDGEANFLCGFDCAALARADAAELRRAYVALMNFWNQQDRLGDAALDYANLECGLAGEKRPCGWGRHYEVEREAVPAEALSIAASDPLLEVLFGFMRGDEKGEESSPEDEADLGERALIRDPARLGAFIDKVERSVPLLREAVAKVQSDGRSLAAAHSAAEDFRAMLAAREELKVYHLEDETVADADEGAWDFGLPEGALLIRARVYPFEMAMARADGRLKLLVVYPDFDGD